MALKDLRDASDKDLIQSALAVIALARGQLQLGAFLRWIDDSVLSELVEEKMAWSKLYV